VAVQERPRIEYRTPADLVRDVRSGLLRIPWFQRGFQWEASDVVKLFDSVTSGYPIGAAPWVVDGQQRTASLVGAVRTEAATRFGALGAEFDRRLASLPIAVS
jgi:hypothetical protein